MAPRKGETHREKAKEEDVRMANINAGKTLADIVRTSLGPRGADKMIIEPKGDVLITNDGATILSKLSILHPCARMLVETSKAQDVEAGDGTTSVVVLAGALLRAAEGLLAKNIHPTHIAESFMLAQRKAEEILQSVASPCDIDDRDKLIQAAITSLASKVVSHNSAALAPIAVDAVKAVTKPASEHLPARVDLNDVKLVKVVGGTMDDTELVDGLVFEAKASKMGGGPTHIANAKIALIQFQLSPPKTDMENNVVVKNYDQMDRVFKEEREYLLSACKTIAQAGCNVLLIQKSILRDAVTEQSLHFLAKMKIMVIRDIERSDVEFICKTLGCRPIASLESFKADKFGFAARAEEVRLADTKVIKITGVTNPLTRTVLVRGATQMVVDEAERSLHDAMCVVRCLVKKHFLIAGGGAPEAEASVNLLKFARTLEGVNSLCVRAYAEALQIIPYTLAENAGLPPIQVTTELHHRHNNGDSTFGINVRKGTVTDMFPDVVQPLLVSLSALSLATETVVAILKIDDIVQTR